MAIASYKLKCPGCGFGIHCKFRMPKLMEPRTITVKCADCECTVLFKLMKYKSFEMHKPGEIKVMTKLMVPGALYLAMKKEEMEMQSNDTNESI